MKVKPWLQFFRLPNLPTAPGDALAGAAVAMALAGGDFRLALVAGSAAFFLYAYGLADNDVAGAAEDGETAPERPIPSGEISLRAAKIVRSACLFAALLPAAFFNLPPKWWLSAAVLTGMICLYNRMKNLWLMGLCRGLSVLCGGLAVLPAGKVFCPAVGAVALMAVGWTLYVAAVTKLSEGEDHDSDGLGTWRFFSGMTALAPLAAGFFFTDFRMWLLPVLGCTWTLTVWCVLVRPLGIPHDSVRRRQAVGRAVAALLYMQIGFMLAVPSREFVAAAVAVWLAARFIRRFVPSVSGS